jgi:hypothetical protein
MVMQIMGVQPMLHSAQMPWKQRSPGGEKVHVYVDVSGSMNSVLNALYGAVLDCKDMVFGKVHLFSNRIADVTLDELRKGKASGLEERYQTAANMRRVATEGGLAIARKRTFTYARIVGCISIGMHHFRSLRSWV